MTKAKYKIGMFVEIKGEMKTSLERIDALVLYKDRVEYLTDKSDEPVKETDIVTAYKPLADRKKRVPKEEKAVEKTAKKIKK